MVGEPFLYTQHDHKTVYGIVITLDILEYSNHARYFEHCDDL